MFLFRMSVKLKIYDEKKRGLIGKIQLSITLLLNL